MGDSEQEIGFPWALILNVGASQVVGGGHTGATSPSASRACPGSPLVAQHERRRHHTPAMAELPDIDDSPPARLAGPSDSDYQLSPTQSIVRRFETAPAIRVKSPQSTP